MTEKEATQIIIETHQKINHTEIQVLEINSCTDKQIRATTSYVWHLNGWRKEVIRTDECLYKDDLGKWQTL